MNASSASTVPSLSKIVPTLTENCFRHFRQVQSIRVTMPLFYPRRVKGRYLASALLFLLFAIPIQAQKRIDCPDGVHYEIDLSEIIIKYQATSFSATLSGLSIFRNRIGVEPKMVQKAEAATQQWNEFLKGLVAGYNSCAITKQEYAEGLQRIYPRLREDAADLEKIRKIISAGNEADEERLRRLLESYLGNLERLAEISSQEIILERIEALLSGSTKEIKGEIARSEQNILERFDQLEERLKNVAPPSEVKEEISELRATLLAKVDEAEAAYEEGYDLLQRFRFAEAIPHLQTALKDVKLPDFYFALGTAFLELSDLPRAERVLREGLAQITEQDDEKHEASLSNQLGRTLQAQGDLAGALKYTRRALAIDEKVYGPEHPTVAIRANNIGQILKDQGDLAGALEYTRRALAIGEKVYGPEHPQVAIFANNIGQILKDQGDLAGALEYTRRALAIDEKVYGPEHPRVAAFANNIGTILKDQGDLAGALEYTKRALAIDEKVYGPEHPQVALFANNIGQILQAQGDLAGALEYTRRALAIDEKVYGPEHPAVAQDANNIGLILKDQGDLAGALEYTRRALAIDEKVYGPEHPDVAIRASNIGQILQDQGDLAGALEYTRRALAIGEKVYGPEHPTVGIHTGNIGQILQDQGDLAGALEYTRRTLAIHEKVYGPEHPIVAIGASTMGQILKAQGDLAGALQYSRRALAIGEKVYGPEHPHVATYANNIGQILKAQGDLAGALEYVKRALQIFEKVYGKDNPLTKIAAANLEFLKQAMK